MTGQISELKAPSTFGRAANLTSHQVTAGVTESKQENDKPTLDAGKETHLNLVDNSLVPKIGQVSYKLDDPLDCLVLATRPHSTLDLHFEQVKKRRMTKFHARQIDRTQYDKEMLEK